MTRSLLPVEIEQEEEQELTASAQALLDLDTEAPPAVGKKAQAPGKTQRHRFRWIWILGLFAVLAADRWRIVCLVEIEPSNIPANLSETSSKRAGIV